MRGKTRKCLFCMTIAISICVSHLLFTHSLPMIRNDRTMKIRPMLLPSYLSTFHEIIIDIICKAFVAIVGWIACLFLNLMFVCLLSFSSAPAEAES